MHRMSQQELSRHQDAANELIKKMTPFKIKTDYGFNLKNVRNQLCKELKEENTHISSLKFAIVYAMFHGYSKEFIFLDEYNQVRSKHKGKDLIFEVGYNMKIFLNISPTNMYSFGRHYSFSFFGSACSPSIFNDDVLESRDKAILFAHNSISKGIKENCQNNSFYRGRAKQEIHEALKNLEQWKDRELKTHGELFEWALFN